MALEVKQVLEYLGFNAEKIQSIDDLKPEFEGAFVRTSTLNMDNPLIQPILGRVYGTQESELRRFAKEIDPDFDFDSEDFKANKKVTEKTKFILSKIAEKKQAAFDELKKQSSKGGEEKVREYETKYEQAKREKADTQNLLDSLKSEYDAHKESASKQLKTVKLDYILKDEYSKIKYKQGASDYEKEGLYSTVNKELNFDIDDEGNGIVTDKNGKRIPSTTTAGTFKTIPEVLKDYALKGNLLELNPQGGKPATPTSTFTQTGPIPSAAGERKIAPRMM